MIACKKTPHGEVCEKSFPLGCYKADSQIEPAQCKALVVFVHSYRILMMREYNALANVRGPTSFVLPDFKCEQN